MNNDQKKQDTTHSANLHRRSTDDLLDELQSLKYLLEESGLDEDELDAELDIDIPILDDVVAEDGETQDQHSLLDLKSIFEENDTAEEDNLELNFESLDVDIDIPAFKLSLSETPTPLAQPVPATFIPETNEPTSETEAELELSSELLSPNDSIEYPATESATDLPAAIPLSAAEVSSPAVDVDMDLLVQEIVDEFLPIIELRLRERLNSYPVEILVSLAEKKLKS